VTTPSGIEGEDLAATLVRRRRQFVTGPGVAACFETGVAPEEVSEWFFRRRGAEVEDDSSTSSGGPGTWKFLMAVARLNETTVPQLQAEALRDGTVGGVAPEAEQFREWWVAEYGWPRCRGAYSAMGLFRLIIPRFVTPSGAKEVARRLPGGRGSRRHRRSSS
jgi:hypothetical protein